MPSGLKRAFPLNLLHPCRCVLDRRVRSQADAPLGLPLHVWQLLQERLLAVERDRAAAACRSLPDLLSRGRLDGPSDAVPIRGPGIHRTIGLAMDRAGVPPSIHLTATAA